MPSTRPKPSDHFDHETSAGAHRAASGPRVPALSAARPRRIAIRPVLRISPPTDLLLLLLAPVLATLLAGALHALRLIGPRASSALVGWAAQQVGGRLRESGIADRNLRAALPDMDATTRQGVIRAVWNNLGRTLGELPHLATFTRTPRGPGWEIEGEEHIDALTRQGGQALFFSGHFGNWEMILPIAGGIGLPVSGFYRAASNRHVDAVIQSMRHRALGPQNRMFPKGAEGARDALGHLQAGGSLGLLVDQKMNDGIAVPFFGRPAMTAPALARLALRFDLPIMPVYVLRLGGGRFRMVCEKPIDVPRTGNREADTYAITLMVNATLERWIRARPATWLWLHRRWPKEPPRQDVPACGI
ncbi:lysophospholipid acyltransferase family protein [Gluconacetobacter tumulisoli]|uniref:Lauroyl acyltransferase n=1 Tax=Gluconacetobacter tumulisoli TaxID=1286189 RepID=A0A7W4K5I2_9PROT|nr:lauroyl acyltransferase [Gluconacetobacter tumulisoli]MBB2200789.1 lauroyl acyltransferase [Gluconacetobacter tumulisoli]